MENLYENWLAELMPPRLQGPLAQVLMKAIGREQDISVERLRQGLLARYAASAPEDALIVLGRARLIERYPGESLDDWAARVIGAGEFWAMAGTEQGMINGLRQSGYTARIAKYKAPDESLFDVHLAPGRLTWSGLPYERNRIVYIINRLKKADSKLARVFYHTSTVYKIWGQDGLTWGQSGLTWGSGRVQIWP